MVGGSDKYLHQDLRKGATILTGILHLLLIRTLRCWMLSKEASSTIFWGFGQKKQNRSDGKIEPLFLELPQILMTFQ